MVSNNGVQQWCPIMVLSRLYLFLSSLNTADCCCMHEALLHSATRGSFVLCRHAARLDSVRFSPVCCVSGRRQVPAPYLLCVKWTRGRTLTLVCTLSSPSVLRLPDLCCARRLPHFFFRLFLRSGKKNRECAHKLWRSACASWRTAWAPRTT